PEDPTKSLKIKELKNNLPSNRFALLPALLGLAIKRTTRTLLPANRFFGHVEAPQSTRDRMLAQRPVAFHCEGELARMNRPQWREAR
ncbi:MAG: hypothetical protein ACRD51_08395, partial [Candidatus Acidiferrum sp.]